MFPYDFRDERMMRSLKEMTQTCAGLSPVNNYYFCVLLRISLGIARGVGVFREEFFSHIKAFAFPTHRSKGDSSLEVLKLLGRTRACVYCQKPVTYNIMLSIIHYSYLALFVNWLWKVNYRVP